MTLDRELINDPSRATLADADLPGVAGAVLTLAQELWVVSDRLYVLERVLADQGVDVSGAVESYQPSAEDQAELDARGERLLARLLEAFAGQSATPGGNDDR